MAKESSQPRPKQPRCRDCQHVRSFHSIRLGGCQAIGCHGGPDEGPCPEFVEADAEALSA